MTSILENNSLADSVVVALALHLCEADGPRISGNIYYLCQAIYCRENEDLSVLDEGRATGCSG